jgi:hypothetical protein
MICHFQKKPDMKHNTDKNCYIEPPTLKTVWMRLPEIITDPASNQLSCSRFIFFWVGFLSGFIAIHETLEGRATNITGMVTAIIATSATIYSLSTVKDWRWKKRHDGDCDGDKE